LPIIALLAATTSAAAVGEEREQQPRNAHGVELGAPVTPYVFDGDVRDLPRPERWRPGDPVREIPRRGYIRPGVRSAIHYEPGIDPHLETQQDTPVATISNFVSPTRNFAGAGFTGVNPPDTVGDVGPSHYIQMVNDFAGTLVLIYDKAEPTPNLLANFILDAMGGGECANGYGDPIVLYDRFADRWLLQEFSKFGYWLCVYVSQTGDPVNGGWYNYNFATPYFPDYPKYGVWPTDANGGMGSYIVTTNESAGPAAYALDRGSMLTGSVSTSQRFALPELSGFIFQAVTPADIDGPAPPPTYEPAVVMRHRDTENHGGPVAPGDLLEMWAIDVDWSEPANSTIIEQPAIDIAEFDSDLCGLTTYLCFPQPDSGITLDPLREIIMWRLQYINHFFHQTLVGNFVTDVDGNDHGGVRWFELRGGHGGWYLEQEGTYAVDEDHRWMAAGAMDQSGNIALAYNVSSDVTYPSLRYTGRLADDQAGVMTAPETVIHGGSSYNGTNRYGDYSSMNLDPADDCTFWFTGEDNTDSAWRTQIASFRFEACGCDSPPDPLEPTATANGDNRIDVDWSDSELETVVEYSIFRSLTPGGPYEIIATIPDSSPDDGGGAGYVFADTDVSGGITYYYLVIANDGSRCRSAPLNETFATAIGSCMLGPNFAGLQEVETPFSAICTLDLSWNPGSDECGGPLAYNVYRSRTAGFTPLPADLLVSGVADTTLSDANVLSSGELYHYVVRAIDLANGIEENNVVELSGRPLGELAAGTWYDDAGDVGDAKLVSQPPWSIEPTEGNTAPNVYKTGDYGDSICSALTTPRIRLGSGSVLTFWSKFDIETDWDKGEVQISTDDGLSFERVETTYPGTSFSTLDSCGLPLGDYFTGEDLTWVEYTADLSSWEEQDAILRFVISSDSAVSRSGWWIDDIAITDVGLPGSCTTAVGCEDNPLVDVDPEGPITECSLDGPLLNAGLSGGVGPFTYQWYMDGYPIAGATAEDYRTYAIGSHSYNVKVRSESCPDEVKDSLDSVVILENRPDFAGLTSVYDLQQESCAVMVEWDAGTAVCHGPLRYYVYRDTDPAVSPVPDNIVASGLEETTFLDSSGLVDGFAYHYLVRAMDWSTGAFDTNDVVAAATPTAPGSGAYEIFTDDFENPATWDDWTVTTGPGAHTCGDWVRSDSATERPSGGSGYYALSDSEGCDPVLPQTSTKIDSPAIDLDIEGIQVVTLEYDLHYEYHDGGDTATVEIWDGADWDVIWTDPDSDVDTHHSIDVTSTAAGVSDFRIRYNFQNAADDRWFSFDNVALTVDIYHSCSTGNSPPPAPNGSGSSSPLLGNRLTAGGDSIELSWDAATCPAADYNLLYGALASVSNYTLSGSVCSLGTSGQYIWDPVPAGDLFFLIVGSDDIAVESSWGFDSLDGERNGMLASGECLVLNKDISNNCP
jgi:hypothetical protein